MIRILFFLVAVTFSSLQAEIVAWNASGSVTSVTGSMTGGGVTVGQDVCVGFSYDSDANFFAFSSPGFGQSDVEFYDDIDLEVRVTIGTAQWKGSIATTEFGSPRTLEARFQSAFSIGEVVYVRLSEQDGASFSDFPLSSETGSDAINLQFNAASTLDFLGFGLSSLDIDESEVTAASGNLSTGTGTVVFTLLPASLVVQDADQPVPVPSLAAVRDGAMVTLTWLSETGLCYSLEGTTDLEAGDWTPFLTIPGDGTVKSPSVALGDETEFFRLVATR